MVVLATKIYVEGDARERTLRSLDGIVGDRVGALDVEWSVGVRHDDFPSVTVEGPDAAAARNALAEEFGQIDPHGLSPGDVAVGTLESWDDHGVILDAGRSVRVPAADLGLGPGTPADVRERFGLVQHLPMSFAIPEDDDPGSGTPAPGDASTPSDGDPTADAGSDGEFGPEPLVAELAERERDRLFEWRRGAGRVNVNSATRSEVRATVNRAGHADDVVGIERLGLLEQSIVCAEGTDPPGLLASIGDYLPAEMRCVIPD